MKKGISLIVLVITIIVLAILAGAIIISISNTNVMTKASEAVAKADLANAKNILTLEFAQAVSKANDGIAYNTAPVYNADGSVATAGVVMTAAHYVKALSDAGIKAVNAGVTTNDAYTYYVTVDANGVPTLSLVSELN